MALAEVARGFMNRHGKRGGCFFIICQLPQRPAPDGIDAREQRPARLAVEQIPDIIGNLFRLPGLLLGRAIAAQSQQRFGPVGKDVGKIGALRGVRRGEVAPGVFQIHQRLGVQIPRLQILRDGVKLQCFRFGQLIQIQGCATTSSVSALRNTHSSDWRRVSGSSAAKLSSSTIRSPP